MSHLVKHVRYGHMALKELMKSVRPTGALPDATIFQLVDLLATDAKDVDTTAYNMRRREAPPHYCDATNYFGDNTGILYWIGTGDGKNDSYNNPIPTDVSIHLSSVSGAKVESIADRDPSSAAVENNYGR
jgi:hypothetical protein